MNIMCVLIGVSGTAFSMEEKISKAIDLKIEIKDLEKKRAKMWDKTAEYARVDGLIKVKEKQLKSLLPAAKL